MNFRILYVDTENVWRGGQDQVLSLILGIRDLGHEVALAAPSNSALAQKVRKEGIRHYAFGQRHELSPKAFWDLLAIMRSFRCSIVHFNTPRPIVAGSAAAHFCGVNLCISSRRVNFPLRSVLSRLKYNLFSDAIITVSDSIRETLTSSGIHERLVKVVYEGVDLEWIDSLSSPDLLLGESGPIVGTVAHLSPEKGHGSLIKAAAHLSTRFPKARFVIVGDGELRQQLEEQVYLLELEERVLFTGFRTDSEALMKQFDIFCLPSLSEGLSSAILCAMASRLPVIATRAGGIPELVTDGETGLLVPPDDPLALAKALDRLLGSEKQRHLFGLAGRLRVERNFTVKRKVVDTEQLYQSLLATKAIG